MKLVGKKLLCDTVSLAVNCTVNDEEIVLLCNSNVIGHIFIVYSSGMCTNSTVYQNP